MTLNIRLPVKAVLKSWWNYRNHHSSVIGATRALKSVESYRGLTNNRDLKFCDQYAVDVLGHKRFAPWLYVYTALSGEFKEGWIPDNYYGAVVVQKIQGRYGRLANLKPLNTFFFQSDAFPDVLSYVNGIFFDREHRLVPTESVQATLFAHHERVVFKLEDSMRGRGIHVFDRDSFSVQRVKRLGNGLFQSFIQQHGVFLQFAKDAVATLRITTVCKDDGEISVRGCCLRLGTGNDTHVQSQSEIKVAIDLESGAFSQVGYTPEWLETRVHPASQVEFFGNVIPAFKKCIQTVTDMHKNVPYVRCIGWDVAVDTEEKVRLMEWNGDKNGIKFHEATQGPCFADLGWERLRK